MSAFTAQQVEQLLRPIHPSRVATTQGNAYVPQQDVIAHLIRVFGFGNFDVEVREVECIFEHNRPTNDGKPSNRWDVGYRALVRLTIRNDKGAVICRYDGGATGAGQNQSLDGAHDLAYKTALSTAMKRAAIHLGDQFGLSLYNKGQRTALVIDTFIKPATGKAAEGADMQEGVPQQVAEDQDAPSIEPDDEPRGLSAALAKGGQQ